MATQRVKVVQRKAKPYLLHEFNQKGQHRLVMVEEEGNKASRWFESHQIGWFEGMNFAGYGASPIKPGVFRQQMLEARMLPEDQNGGAMALAMEKMPENKLTAAQLARRDRI